MKKSIIKFGLLIILLIIGIDTQAQIQKLAGPRIGITMVEPGLLANILRKDVRIFSDENTESWEGTSLGKYGAIMSQYGWQWESRFTNSEKVVGIVEWVAIVGGIEKGMFLPSVSSLVGIRTDKGIEFAAGPNLSLGGIAMVIGAGYNFKVGNLNIPVNIAYVPSMNKSYHHEAVYRWVNEYDESGNIIGGYEEVEALAYDMTHPIGARVSIMVGLNTIK